MARAAIDIGSNSLLLTILDDDGTVLDDRAEVVGLGTGLGDHGMFLPDRMAAAEEVLTAYVSAAQAHGIQPWNVRAVATSGARRAMNAETWFARIARKLQLRVKIISGEEEARLAWLGAIGNMNLPAAPCLVVDLGGGSTELVLGQGHTVYSRSSLELGSVRLTEAMLTDPVDPEAVQLARSHVDIELTKIPLAHPPALVIGLAGTVTTLAAMAAGLTDWNAALIQGTALGLDQLSTFVDQLRVATPAQRALLAAVAPKRAPFLLAGAIILERVLIHARAPEMLVSDRGLRYGLLAR